jgi:hypothetical protein
MRYDQLPGKPAKKPAESAGTERRQLNTLNNRTRGAPDTNKALQIISTSMKKLPIITVRR